MRKASLKSFFYSFLLSLFALFVVDGAYMRAKTAAKEEILIPNKNITLFFKNAPKANMAQIEPIKKIALSTPTLTEAIDDIPLDSSSFQEFSIASLEDAAEIPIDFLASEEIVDDIGGYQEIATAEERDEDIIRELLPDKITKEEILLAKEDEIVQEMTIAQLDATPDEIESIFSIPIEKSDKEANESLIVNISTEGKLNQIAMASNEFTSQNINHSESFKNITREEVENKKWETMEEKENNNPWVVAKGTKFPKNNMVLEETYFNDMSENEIKKVLNRNNHNPDEEYQIAAEIVQNILIPIPEKIMQEENITPRLISTEEEKENDITEDLKKEIEENEISEEEKKSIFKSLTSIFSSSSPPTKQVGVTKQSNKESNSFFNQITKKIKGDNKEATPVKILPTEMRLSFQPNRAEISGQTLKWIHAFANKTIEEEDVILEVRIDGTTPSALQQKRLNLLNNILNNKGVDPNKVSIVFTSREPNSFIIRTLRVNKDTIETQKASTRKPSYYQQW